MERKPLARIDGETKQIPDGDTINWSWLSGIPEYATRWPAWGEVTGKPTTFTPTAHTHTWADITGTVPTWNQNTTGSAASLTTARTLQIGNTGKAFNGTANVSWTLSEIGALAASAVGAASGVAPLGPDTKVPSSYLPSYVDDVLEYSSLSAFPTTGETGKIYVADDTGKIYRWSGSTYIEISPSPGSTDAVPEGATNLYFTTARAAAAAPVQSVAGKTGDVVIGYGDLTGSIPTWNQNTTGNAGTATKLATARTISLSGDASGSASFDGTGNISIPVVVADDSHNHVISNVDGLQAALDGKLSTTGNAATATKLQTARTLKVTGATASVSFDGSANITIPTTGAFNINGSGPSAQVDGLYVADLGTTEGTTLNPTYTAAIVGQVGAGRSIAVSVDSSGYLWGYHSHTDAGTYTFQSKTKYADQWTTACTIKIGNTGKSVNGSAPVSWTVAEIGAAPSSHVGAGGNAHAAATTSASGFMTADQVSKLEGLSAPVALTATIPTTGWTNKAIDIAVAGMSELAIVSPATQGDADAWAECGLWASSTTAGVLHVEATKVPNAAISVNIISLG